jgi:hypothetical protein
VGAQAKAAPSWAVNVAVWVRNPGPMALVAIRKIAPSTAERAAASFTGRCGAELRGVSWVMALDRASCSTIPQYFDLTF